MTAEERAEHLSRYWATELDRKVMQRDLADAIRQAVLEERAGCADLAEDLAPSDPTDSRYHGAREAAARIAAAIRTRPEP